MLSKIGILWKKESLETVWKRVWEGTQFQGFAQKKKIFMVLPDTSIWVYDEMFRKNRYQRCSTRNVPLENAQLKMSCHRNSWPGMCLANKILQAGLSSAPLTHRKKIFNAYTRLLSTNSTMSPHCLRSIHPAIGLQWPLTFTSFHNDPLQIT